jgi:nicotinate-nucleotide pyrophosphorylase (carboxylating)
MVLRPLPTVMLEPLVRAALLEDLGRVGDLTTVAIVPPDLHVTTALVTRQPGVAAGLDLAALAFRLIAPDIGMEVYKPDGSRLAAGDTLAKVRGPAAQILMAERVALNFLCT